MSEPHFPNTMIIILTKQDKSQLVVRIVEPWFGSSIHAILGVANLRRFFILRELTPILPSTSFQLRCHVSLGGNATWNQKPLLRYCVLILAATQAISSRK